MAVSVGGATLLRAAGLGLLTAVLVWGALVLPRELDRVSPIWPANAFALVVLLRSRTARWPLFAGASVAANALVNLALGDTASVGCTLALLNGAEVLACAVAVRRLCGRRFDLSDNRTLTVFVAAGLSAPVVCGFLAAALLQADSGGRFLTNFVTWAAADAVGLLLLTPTLLALLQARRDLRDFPLTRSTVLSLAILSCVAVLVFAQDTYPLLFLVSATLLVVAVRSERLGTAIGIVIVGTIGLSLSYLGMGPVGLVGPGVIGSGLTRNILVLQIFLAICAGSSLYVASLVTQRRLLHHSVRAAYEHSQEASRRAAMAEAIARIGYWSFDVASGVLVWSPNMFRIYGLKPAEQVDLDAVLGMTHPEDMARAQRRFAEIMAGGEPDEGITRILCGDDSLRFISGKMVSERGPDGAVRAIFGTIADVTSQQLDKRALADSETRYRRLADNVSDVIATYGADGVLRYLSPSIVGLLGYRPEELVGMPLSAVLHPGDAARVSAELDAYVQAGPGAEEPRIGYRALSKQGDVLWLEAHPKAVYIDGDFVEVQDMVRDVTAREMIKAELVEARRVAEAAVKVKSEFLANMSHELRTPLTSILGFTKLAAEQEDLVGRTRGYVERVTEAGRALLCTVNDILDFSQVEAGQIAIRPAPVAPCRLARSTLDLFMPQAGAKDVALRIDCDLPEDYAVLADPDRLRQILLNLVGNAAKFTQCGEVTVDIRHDGALLAIEVRDTGPGLTAEACTLLFRRFSQVDGSSTREHSGTGLGLAICKGLVEAMGGRIGVDSRPGEGSRFWFEIPAPRISSNCEPVGMPEPDASPDAAAPRVLVVDDHAANRELARLFLSAIGAEVTEACGGAEAVEIAMRAPFDVILMDLRMPVVSGFEATRSIRAGGPNDGAPILAFTADVQDFAEERLRREGFDGVVAKPLDARSLIAAVLQFARAEPACVQERSHAG